MRLETEALPTQSMPTRFNAEYVRMRRFAWYATWPQWSLQYARGSQSKWTLHRRPARYTPALGPFWFRWLAKRAVKRNI